ncbi:hypothetical protein SP90_13540 [Halodesulfovibrio spirochaetisodalis]|uniref:Terminase n=2 Tax=Halodesulfovibrio spirochaetisodalis TaxID=1560234 RepID=A0A1B7XA78_9BACT|nr:hypothetical protein SP90_13540 [Halodesulfovibrio spirochaetisodalis]
MKMKLANRFWRLNNLYKIIDKNGDSVRFTLNPEQTHFISHMHTRNVILKARQLGFTTFSCVFGLDLCLFNSNTRVGIIAQTMDDVKKIYRDKVLYAFKNLPPSLLTVPGLHPQAENAQELLMCNNSSIAVGLSFRSGTLHFLHVSELGKIAARFPQRAKEVKTGALPTVPTDGIVVFESTAEGDSGLFFDTCDEAQRKARLGEELTNLDFKFHFFPWHQRADYVLPAGSVRLTPEQEKYFVEMEGKLGFKFSPEQKAWYSVMENNLKEDMKREYPTTPEEAFAQTVEGAYYGTHMAQAEAQGRVCDVPFDPLLQVHTSWDLGMSDTTPIWFFQHSPAGQRRYINYYEASGEGLEHYAGILEKFAKQFGYRYGVHIAPHDIRVRELGTGKSRLEKAKELGIKFEICPSISVQDGIDAVRTLLPSCWFDKVKCTQGLKALRHYRKKWNEDRGCFESQPLHDWASNGADSMRYSAVGFKPPVQRETPTHATTTRGRKRRR